MGKQATQLLKEITNDIHKGGSSISIIRKLEALSRHLRPRTFFFETEGEKGFRLDRLTDASSNEYKKYAHAVEIILKELLEHAPKLVQDSNEQVQRVWALSIYYRILEQNGLKDPSYNSVVSLDTFKSSDIVSLIGLSTGDILTISKWYGNDDKTVLVSNNFFNFSVTSTVADLKDTLKEEAKKHLKTVDNIMRESTDEGRVVSVFSEALAPHTRRAFNAYITDYKNFLLAILDE